MYVYDSIYIYIYTFIKKIILISDSEFLITHQLTIMLILMI